LQVPLPGIQAKKCRKYVYGAVNLAVFVITDGIFEKTIRRKDVEIMCDLKYNKFIVRL